jgi:hypothetical protein
MLMNQEARVWLLELGIWSNHKKHVKVSSIDSFSYPLGLCV